MEKHSPRRIKHRESSSPRSHPMSPSSTSSSSPTAAARQPSSLHRRSSDYSSAAFIVRWPSASASASASTAANKSLSLAEHLTHERLLDPPAQIEHKKNGRRGSIHPATSGISSPQPLIRQLSRFKQEEEDVKKKNHNPNLKGGSPTIIGGSMRYIGEVIRLPPSPKPGGSSSPSSSVDLVSRPLRRGKSDDLRNDFPSSEFEGKISNSTPNRPELDQLGRLARSSSVTGSGSPWAAATAQGKTGSFISLGLDLFRRGKGKEKPSCYPSTSSSSYGSLNKGRVGDEYAHQLKATHNRLIQWRWVNARTERVDLIKTAYAEISLSTAWLGLSNLQARVVRKRVQLEKDKLHLKLVALLSSQLKALEEWNRIAQQHASALSATKNCLQASLCRLPLMDGAKLDLRLLQSTLRHATDLDLTTRIATNIITDHKVSQLQELSLVVSRERALLDECFDLLGFMSSLHIQEQSLKCHVIQSRALIRV